MNGPRTGPRAVYSISISISQKHFAKLYVHPLCFLIFPAFRVATRVASQTCIKRRAITLEKIFVSPKRVTCYLCHLLKKKFDPQILTLTRGVALARYHTACHSYLFS